MSDADGNCALDSYRISGTVGGSFIYRSNVTRFPIKACEIPFSSEIPAGEAVAVSM